MGYQNLLRHIDPDKLLVTQDNRPNTAAYFWAPKQSLVQQHNEAKTAAVIFNSPNLLRHHYGKLIDQHDVVLRHNFAPTIGFEKHVGTKTTARVMARNWTFIEKDETIVRIHNGSHFIHKDNPFLRKQPHLAAKFNASHPHFVTASHQYLRCLPSTGFFGAVLALMWVDRVSLFGYDFRWERTRRRFRPGQRMHYFDDVENAKQVRERMRDYALPDQEWRVATRCAVNSNYRPVHSMLKEYDFYNEAYDDGKIEIYPPLKRILLL
jgi:hypothetical protein